MPGGSAPKNLGGRGTQEDEARKWLAKNNLVAQPAGLGAPMDPAPDAQPGYVVDPEFVRSTVQTLLEGWEGYRVRKVFRVARDLVEEPEAKALAQEAAAPPGCIQVMTDCSVETLRKYNLLAACAPEVLLLVAGGMWLAKDLVLAKRLQELKEAADKAKAKDDAVNAPSH